MSWIVVNTLKGKYMFRNDGQALKTIIKTSIDYGYTFLQNITRMDKPKGIKSNNLSS